MKIEFRERAIEAIITLRDLSTRRKKQLSFLAGIVIPVAASIGAWIFPEYGLLFISLVILPTILTHHLGWRQMDKQERGLGTDSLTGMLNKQGVLDALFSRYMSAIDEHRDETRDDPYTPIKKSLALLYFDLDNFKLANDHLGHHTADLVLKQIAVILENFFRDFDIVGRLHGDEFAAAIFGVSMEALEERAQSLLSLIDTNIADYLEKNGKHLPDGQRITATMGISFTRTICLIPGTKEQVLGVIETEWLQKAEGLMRAVKKDGRKGTWSINSFPMKNCH